MADLSIEVGHCYADELVGHLPLRIKTDLDALGPRAGRTGILVDDYNADLPMSRQDAHDYALQWARLDYVQFESDGRDVAALLLDRAGDRIDVDGDRVRFTRETRAESSAVLVAEGQRFCCPTLAACWSLARLGISPYTDAYQGFGSFTGERLLTVLPTKFLRVEATVLDLIAAAGYRKAAKRIGYVFA